MHHAFIWRRTAEGHDWWELLAGPSVARQVPFRTNDSPTGCKAKYLMAAAAELRDVGDAVHDFAAFRLEQYVKTKDINAGSLQTPEGKEFWRELWLGD